MNPTVIGLIIGGVVATLGVLLLVAARVLAKINVWGQSQMTKIPMLKSLGKIANYDEQASITMIRCVGVGFIIIGILAPIIAIGLSQANAGH